MSSKEIQTELKSAEKIAVSKHKNFRKQVRSSRKAYVDKYGGTADEFDKIYLSNLKYDLQMNGMEYTPENVETILTHDGFIKNSAAYNKRLQIWMNNAWSGDRAFIHERVPENNPLNERGNYNYIIVSDLGKAFDSMTGAQQKAHQQLVKRLNNELSEHVDGAIIVSDKVIDAINADFGVPDSGQNKSFIVSPHKTRGAILGKYMLHGAGPKMSELMDKEGLHMIMQDSAIKQHGRRELGDIV